VGFFRYFNLTGEISSCNLNAIRDDGKEEHGEQHLSFCSDNLIS